MINIKKSLLTTLFFFTLSNKTYSAIFLEPYAGFVTKSYTSTVSTQENKYSGNGYLAGFRSGFALPIGVNLGIDASYAKISGDQELNGTINVEDKSSNLQSLGALLGIELFMGLSAYLVYDFYHKLTFEEDFSSGTNYKKDDFLNGKAIKYILQYSFQKLSIFAEYKVSTTNTMKRFSTEYSSMPDWYSEKDSSIAINASYRLKFFE